MSEMYTANKNVFLFLSYFKDKSIKYKEVRYASKKYGKI